MAADQLRDFILVGKLAPGVPVPERDLAEALGISRTPLKEALRMLENEGLVTYGPTRRPRVADPSIDELSENLLVLGALEALAGRLASKLVTGEELAAIAALEKRMREAGEETDPLEFFGWDMRFHQAIVSASRNRPLMKTHRQYNARLWRARFLSSRNRARRERTLEEHRGILMALSGRMAESCARRLHRHLETAIDNIASVKN